MRVLQPVRIGARRGETFLDFLIRNDPAFFKVDQQHFARLKAPFLDNRLFRNRQHAHLGRHHHKPLIGNIIPRRTQTIPVQRGANLATIRKRDGGRAIPWLHQRGVIFIKGTTLLVHQRVARPCFRDQHHHRVRERVSALHQKFQRIVKTRRIRLAFIGNRPELRNFSPKQFGINRGLTRRHPVHIAAQRVDLAIMRHHPVGMRQRPGRKRVGREALMHECNRRLEPWITQIREIITQLGRQQHALVDKRPGRQGHRVKALRRSISERVDRVRNHLADDEQPALEGIGICNRGALADENLPVRRLGRLDALAEAGTIHRNIAPAEKNEAFISHDLLDNRNAEFEPLGVTRQKQMTNSVLLGRRQGKAELCTFLAQEQMRDLHQHTATIARLRISANSAAMIEIEQDLQPHLDNGMGFSTFHVSNKTDTAGIFLERRIIRALRQWQARIPHNDRFRRHITIQLGDANI